MSEWLTLSVPALGINPRFLAFGAFCFFFFLFACFLFCKCWLPLWHTDVPRDNPRSLTLLTPIENLSLITKSPRSSCIKSSLGRMPVGW